jgi:hypothetical protein
MSSNPSKLQYKEIIISLRLLAGVDINQSSSDSLQAMAGHA